MPIGRIPTGLNVNDIVNVQVNLAPLAATFRNFGALLILGSSNIIDTDERMRVYTQLSGVASDFGTSAPEYLAAVLFFSQSPQPAILYIGRWAANDTPGTLECGVLTPTQQLVTNFTGISNGGFFAYINGIPYSLVGINLTAQLNLNGIAAQIQTAIDAVDGNTTVIWVAQQQQFVIQSGITGPTSSVSYLSAPTSSGWLNFAAIPTALDTITLGGTIVTFIAHNATPVGNQVALGVDLPTTMTALLTFLNASADSNLIKMTYSTAGTGATTKLYMVAKTPGATGDTITISASVATRSAATLLGGTATDLSALINGTSTTADTPIVGISAEQPVDAVTILDNMSGLWYGVMFATATPPTDAQYLAVAAYIEGAGRSHIFGVTITNTQVLDPLNNAELGGALHTLHYERTCSQYSTSSPYAIASLFGRAFTVNFNANNTVITLKFKQEPGVAAEFITESQAATLRAKAVNVFVNYQNNTAIIQEGTMANGFFFDEVMGTDWLQNQLQVNLYNVLYTSPTKIPQTDPGINILVNACNDTLQGAVFNGLVAPGKWTVAGFGQLRQGDFLTTGYYTFVIPVAQQSQADREARKAPPIQIAVKLAGAVHFAFVIVTVNR
jgi:hypothetical protein